MCDNLPWDGAGSPVLRAARRGDGCVNLRNPAAATRRGVIKPERRWRVRTAGGAVIYRCEYALPSGNASYCITSITNASFALVTHSRLGGKFRSLLDGSC